MPKPNPIVSYLTVSDGAAAIDFYKKAFGAKKLPATRPRTANA
jgi:uncharacterized glyoxalase superfamily protein PhnB